MTRRAGVPAPVTDEEMRRWGVDPEWSRRVQVPGHDGVTRTWHVLEHGPPGDHATPDDHAITVVCVHGNPTWAYLWTTFLRELGDRYRVVAPDQLGMGYSDRTAAPRTYAERVADLDDLMRAVGVTGPVVLAAHDWGGAIAMGWAVDHAAVAGHGAVSGHDAVSDRGAAFGHGAAYGSGVELVGLILTNTGIAVPAGRRAPGVIRLAATPGVHDLATRRTPLFVRGTGWLSRRRLTAGERAALAAPYRRRSHRRAIGDFVGDIPFTPAHPSSAVIESVAERLGDLDLPVLLAWGGRDPVFDDDFAADLLTRFRHADVHRFPTAGHLAVIESAGDGVPGPSMAAVADTWISARVVADGVPAAGVPARDVSTDDAAIDDMSDAGDDPGSAAVRPVWAALDERADDADVAFHDAGAGRSVSFAGLHAMVTGIGAGLHQRGVRRGHRVAVLVPPSVEMVALVYACWRIGAVTVIADRGLGIGGLGRAVRGARVDTVIGPRKALAAARTMRWAPSATTIELGDIVAMGERVGATLPAAPDAGDLAAVLFTSGATGPAKGVRYTQARLAGQRDALAELYGVGADDRFVAAFAPFALYGPALGITSVVPDVDVTTPGALTAEVLDQACAVADATMVFASPAALANVVRTAQGPLPALAAVRTVMSAGAPVPVHTLRAMAALAPSATLHTPYGMTEVLPVADIDLAGIERAGQGGGRRGGVCVGRPVSGCQVAIAPLPVVAANDVTGSAAAPNVVADPVPTGQTGEVLVSSPWMSAGYDALWLTQHGARPVDDAGREWHRSGDVGHLDDDGRLWIEGRAVHVIHTAGGPVTPVPVEVQVETIDGVDLAAAVGVGPVGIQQLVVAVQVDGVGDGLADIGLTEAVRAAVWPQPVAAVCTRSSLPVDIRHNAKIDRGAVAAWAERLLAGGSSRVRSGARSARRSGRWTGRRTGRRSGGAS